MSDAYDEATGAPERTGEPAVDAVLDSLDRLDAAPVAEHAATFETADELLRAALSDADAAGRPVLTARS